MSEHILKEYDDNLLLYKNLKNKMEVLLKELLFEGVSYHNVSSRVKERDSLIKKIDRKNKYKTLNEITDIVGCRIIAYFEDDVDLIVDMIKNEFDIDDINSTDKKNDLESDKFGYLSYHIVCKVNSNRSSLPEYKRYKQIKFEIQVRSILQHAWAEIEHDIGYKSLSGIPKEIRRQFSRVAGLLETADENFCDIKKKINDYNEKINKNKKTLLNTDINLDSLYTYTLNSKLVKEIDDAIISYTVGDLRQDVQKEYLNSEVKRVAFFGLNTIGELENLIKNKSKEIKEFAKLFLNKYDKENAEAFEDDEGPTPWNRGVTYFYLGYYLATKDGDKESVIQYLDNFNFNSEKLLDLLLSCRTDDLKSSGDMILN